MVHYIINPNYIVKENDSLTMLLTPKMDTIYIFEEVASIIIKCFKYAQNIPQATEEIKNNFSSTSFDKNECEKFINELIKEEILVNDTN